MDHPSRPSRSISDSAQRLHTTNAGGDGAQDDMQIDTEPVQAAVRRGHSDSDGAFARQRAFNRMAQDISSEQETWREFLQQSDQTGSRSPWESARQGLQPYLQTAGVGTAQTMSEAQGQLIAERKRRLTTPQDGVRTGHAPERQRTGGEGPSEIPVTQQTQMVRGRDFVDLTTPEPELDSESQRPEPTRLRDEQRRDSDIVLPPWQPDSEVTHCPVCGSQFSFFFRKHHCRKCGRVVCSNCSPHRITIPRQFIVHPPSPTTSLGQTIIDLTADDSDPNQPLSRALGGGEEVRVCNPCVPDPNYSLPPQPTGLPHQHPGQPSAITSFPSQFRSLSGQPPPTRGQPPVLNMEPFSGRPRNATVGGSQPFIPRTAASQHRHTASAQLPPRDSSREHAHVPYGPPIINPHDSLSGGHSNVASRDGSRAGAFNRAGLPTLGTHHGLSGSQFGTSYPGPRVQTPDHPFPALARNQYFSQVSGITQPRFPGAPPQLPTGYRMPSMQDQQPFPHPGQPFHPHFQPPPRTSSVKQQAAQPPPPPRRQIPEEDECPICHQELPPKGPEGQTDDREAHVMSCIESRLNLSSSPARDQPHPTAEENPATRRRHSALPAPPSNTEASSSNTPPSAASVPHPPVEDAPAPPTASGTPTSRPRAPSQRVRDSFGGYRMFPYVATEKDCVDADGNARECTICLEDFEGGDEMARLECWCFFHKACIKGWWETKGPGSCPTHQLHE